jgi:intein/homing endonuclease
MDTTSVATTFPFTSAELSSDKGILYGINSQNESFIIFDRFSLENGNMTVFATSGAGKSLTHSSEVLFENEDGTIKKDKIGKVVNSIFKKGNVVRLEKEIEGVINPKLKVYTFDTNLKGHWSQVEVATRKTTSPEIYNIETRTGRRIEVTGDHCLVTIKNGIVEKIRGDEVNIGSYLPIPRSISTNSAPIQYLDSYKILQKNKFKRLFKKGNRVGIRNNTLGLTIPEKIETTNDFYKLLGFFVAEGMSGKSKVLISSVVPEVLKIIKEYYESIQINYHYAKADNKTVGIFINNGPFRLLLKSIGIYGKADKKHIPQLLYSTSKENVSNFLKAYFEGDGTVGEHEISATTKSKQLSSDLLYTLSLFGIIARVHISRKRATNVFNSRKRTYYKVTISGQDNIKKYIDNIGFITGRKNKLALKLLKKANTNFDVVPELQSTFKEIYNELYNSEIPAPKNFSEVKLGTFKPSREKLNKILAELKNRIYEIESLEGDGISKLLALPTLEEIIKKGEDKATNTLLWQKLDHSWKTMRNGIAPNTKNALLAARVTHGFDIEIDEVGRALYRSFKFTGESLLKFDKPLWETTLYKSANARYEKLLKARDYITEIFKEKLEGLKKVKEKVAWLETLANSDLYWDEIVKITKVKSKHPYVYDLQVENSVFLAGYGGMFIHNSYFVKTEAVRSLMIGSEVIILDPEAEYKALCDAVGGQYIAFSYNSTAKINPFDLTQIREEGENQLGLKILSLHSLMKVIMGEISPSQEAMLDRALIMTYKAKGITNDPETQSKEPPLMEDLYKTLIGMEVPEALDLAARIEKFIRGSFQGIFDKQTNIDLDNPFTVFSVKDIQDAIRPIVMFMILDYIWTRVKRDIKRRILIVEEAWQMMKYPDTAQFLWSVVKRARKYYLGLTTITQDVEDFLGQDIGKAIVTNSALRLLLKQSPTAIDKLGEIFYLSQGEKQLLMAANVGEGIFFAGPHHAPIRIVASEAEHQLINTKPQDNPQSTMPNTKAWNRQE